VLLPCHPTNIKGNSSKTKKGGNACDAVTMIPQKCANKACDAKP
jgi:hypothetical protein